MEFNIVDEGGQYQRQLYGTNDAVVLARGSKYLIMRHTRICCIGNLKNDFPFLSRDTSRRLAMEKVVYDRQIGLSFILGDLIW